jgi:carboxyl-terminal processing protease
MFKKLIFTASLVLGALFCAIDGSAQIPVAPETVIGAAVPDGNGDGVRRQTFDIVWRAVKEKHFDPNLGGVDWDGVRRRFEPRVALVKTDQELYRLLQEMLGELRQSHFNIIPPNAFIPDDQKAPSAGGIGIDLRLVGGQAVISRVDPDSTAFRAGLRPGFVIEQVDGRPVEQMIESITKSADRQEFKMLRMTRRILAAIHGDPGSTVKLSYLDGRDRKLEAAVARERLKGELSQSLGNFPPQYTEFQMSRLPNGKGYAGYIRFNIFTVPQIEKLKKAIADFHDADGLIFDLRGNPGGVGGIASAIAGRICDKPGSLGTMKLRSGEMKFAIFPQANPYTGPVVVLIDGLSASTSEIFSAGLQELKRAVVIGETSAGAALPSIFQKLPTGAIFQFAIADFKTPKGVLIEGRGVVPDIEVKWDRKQLLSGRDAQLEAAQAQVNRIRETSKQKTRAVK